MPDYGTGWYRNVDGVKTARRVPDAGYSVATCDDPECGWRTGPGWFNAIRKRARRHTASRLHMTTVSRNSIFQYAPEPLADGR